MNMKTLLKLTAAAFVFTAGTANVTMAQDVSRGQKLFEECAACHSPDRTATDTIGPSLYGVAGRKAGEDGAFRFSPAMKRSSITWTRESLNDFVADPQKAVPGNRMPYSGMPDAKDRADLIAYLLNAMK
jgi:cytochrome c